MGWLGGVGQRCHGVFFNARMVAILRGFEWATGLRKMHLFRVYFKVKRRAKKEMQKGIRGLPHVEWRMNPQKVVLVGGLVFFGWFLKFMGGFHGKNSHGEEEEDDLQPWEGGELADLIAMTRKSSQALAT